MSAVVDVGSVVDVGGVVDVCGVVDVGGVVDACGVVSLVDGCCWGGAWFRRGDDRLCFVVGGELRGMIRIL